MSEAIEAPTAVEERPAPQNHVFLSYARADVALAEKLVADLTDAGIAVWWDRLMPIGADYDETIEAQLNAAAAVLVLWTETSKRSRHVRDEADHAVHKVLGLLGPGASERDLPFGFRRSNAGRHDEVDAILAALRAKIG